MVVTYIASVLVYGPWWLLERNAPVRLIPYQKLDFPASRSRKKPCLRGVYFYDAERFNEGRLQREVDATMTVEVYKNM